MAQHPRNTERSSARGDERGAVAKALDLLDALADAERPIRLSELAARVDLHRATAHRTLAELLERGFVSRDHQERYVLGPALLRLGQPSKAAASVAALARPHLERLAAATDLMTNVQVLEPGGTRVLDTVRPERYRRILDFKGELLPARDAAGGRVLLAHLDADERRLHLASELRGDPRSGDGDAPAALLDELERELDRIRESGLAHAVGRIDDIIAAVAAALFTAPGRPLCAIAVVGLTQDLAGARLARAERELRRTAAAMQAQVAVGARGAPGGPQSPQ